MITYLRSYIDVENYIPNLIPTVIFILSVPPLYSSQSGTETGCRSVVLSTCVTGAPVSPSDKGLTVKVMQLIR